MTRLPTTADDGAEAFLELANEFGADNVYLMIKLLRTMRGRHTSEDVGAAAMTLLARQLVEAEMTEYHLDYPQARLAVGRRLGYSARRSDNTMTNFNKIVGDEQRVPDTRASSRYRGATGAV